VTIARSPIPSPSNLVWIDLEMTGLDPGTDVILQAAMVITNADLDTLAETAVYIHQPEEALARMTPFVRDMHQRTGLIERVRRSTIELIEAERILLGCVGPWCPAPATLCGNSVWADRGFISRYMPDLDRYLHYRIVDVSSVKVLAQCWYGPAAVFNKPTAGEHDAAVDIHNSIAELRHYRRTLFRDSGV
jgi:oligoribonuclease